LPYDIIIIITINNKIVSNNYIIYSRQDSLTATTAFTRYCDELENDDIVNVSNDEDVVDGDGNDYYNPEEVDYDNGFTDVGNDNYDIEEDGVHNTADMD
jgi:hypothetical protein